jgi:hypothetical protein
MIIKTTEELRDFTRDQVKKSGLSIKEIAEKINSNREKSGVEKRIGADSVSHAVAESKKTDPSRNGMRCEILNLLGFGASTVFMIKRQKKS